MPNICCDDERLNDWCGGGGGLSDGGGGGSWTGLKLVGGGGDSSSVPGGCDGGGMKLLNDDWDGVGKSFLLFLLKLRLSFFSASNLFSMSISPHGGVAFLTKSLVTNILQIPSPFNKDPTTGFWASKAEMSWKTSSKGFSLLKIFFDIELSFCLKQVLLSLSPVA